MKKILFALAITLNLIFKCFSYKSGDKSSIVDNNINQYQEVYNIDEVNPRNFDYYNLTKSDGYTLLEATETIQTKEITNTNFNNEKITNTYSLRYDEDSCTISTIVTTNDGDEIYDINEIIAYPVIYKNNTIDAFIYLNGYTIYLSEIYNNKNKNCFAFALSFAFSSLLYTIIKAALVVSVTIAVGGILIAAVKMTQQWIQEKTRAASIEMKKKNPFYYYPVTRKDGHLYATNSPQGLIEASKLIKTNQDYWSPFDFTAKALVLRAGGSFLGPEKDSNKKGYYYHYHMNDRQAGGHSFYGYPSKRK